MNQVILIIIQNISTIKRSNKESLFSTIASKVYNYFQQTLYKLEKIQINLRTLTEVLGSVFTILILSWGFVSSTYRSDSFRTVNSNNKYDRLSGSIC